MPSHSSVKKEEYISKFTTILVDWYTDYFCSVPPGEISVILVFKYFLVNRMLIVPEKNFVDWTTTFLSSSTLSFYHSSLLLFLLPNLI